MTDSESLDLMATLPKLPDYAVLTKAQVLAVTGLSEATLDRLHHEKSGPPRVQLSTRRIGYPVRQLREWLKQRSKEYAPSAA